MMKKAIAVIVVGILILVIFLGYKVMTFESKQLTLEPIEEIPISDLAIQNFSNAIKIKTVSPEKIQDFDSTQFYQFSDFITNTYPLVDSLLSKKTFHKFSNLYTWKGSDESLKPIVLMAHLDVVPVIKENLPDWKVDPFGGEIKDNVIWGRGTIDNKNGVIGIMEAIELLLKERYSPNRTIYIAIGHDEEIGGRLGAVAIANHLKNEGVIAEYILDEGGTIAQGIIPGLEKDAALIGIAEKGFVSLTLSVKVEGGHSSMPSKETAIDVLATAITKLKNNPFPAEISGALESFMENLGPEMSFINKLAFSNTTIFKSLIISTYEKSPSGNAFVRTTTSPTIFNSGVKENVIPQFASATVNFRILPGNTVESVMARVTEVVDDKRISIKKGDFSSEPSKTSPINSFGFYTIKRTISEIYPEVIISPYLVVGATDSRHFREVSDNIYRFTTIKISKDNIKSFHGLNERISIEDYKNSIRFYIRLLKNSSL